MFAAASRFQSWFVQVNTLVLFYSNTFHEYNLAKDVSSVQRELEAFSLMKIGNY